MVDTTINMTQTRYLKLLKMSIDTGLTTNRIIILCLNKYIPKIRRKNYKFGTRRYQDRAPEWQHVHLYVHHVTFEKYHDITRFHKNNLSLLASKAFDECHDSIKISLENDNKSKTYSDYYTVICDNPDKKVTLISIWDKSELIGAVTTKYCTNDKSMILEIKDW